LVLLPVLFPVSVHFAHADIDAFWQCWYRYWHKSYFHVSLLASSGNAL